MLVSPDVPESLEVVIAAGTVAVGAAFGGILLTQYFSNYRNRGSNCVTGCWYVVPKYILRIGRYVNK